MIKESKKKKKKKPVQKSTNKRTGNPKKEQQINLLKSQVKDFEENIGKLNEKNIRLLAEFDNYKRRTIEEKSNIIKHAVSDFAREWITVIDDLERTIDSIKNINKTDPLINGISLIYEKCNKILSDHDILSFNSIGEKFDPEIHDAMASEEVINKEEGIILSEYQKGYKFHEKVIRHAKVIVNKKKVSV